MPAALTREECQNKFDMMATPQFKSTLLAFLKARHQLVYITTNEERRLLQLFEYISAAEGYLTHVWDCYRGVIDLASKKPESTLGDDIKDPAVILEHIINEVKQQDQTAVKKMMERGMRGHIYILLDFHHYLEDAAPGIERRIKAISQLDSATCVVVVAPYFACTPGTESLFGLLDFPYPNRLEIHDALYRVIDTPSVKSSIKGITEKTKEMEEVLIKSVSGLTIDDAYLAFAKSLVTHKRFDIPTILNEKKQIIQKKEMLEWCDTNVSIDQVGGLPSLVNWIKRRKSAFREDAVAFNLKIPSALMLVGIPGSGKSLTAKAIASAWEMPLLRLDFGTLFNSLQGESERRSRDCLRIAEGMSPVILWLDEVEKGISGTQSSAKTDGGTMNRIFSLFLTWLQEKTKPVFVVATANNQSDIPPEFLRRFDEIFFIDLPNTEGRIQIFSILLNKVKRDHKNFDLDRLAAASNNYSGAEIEKAINEGLFIAYEDNKRVLTDIDILNGLKLVKPLYDLRKDDFDASREWARGRYKIANEKVQLIENIEDAKDIDLR